jgi:sorting nexin-8
MLPVLNAPMMILPGAADLAAKPPQLPRTPSQAKSPPKPRNIRKDSLDDADSDPWGSPAMHKGHNHNSGSKTNGISRSEVNGVSTPVRTTSDFTTTSIDDSNNGNTHNQQADQNPNSTGDLWGSYDGGSSGSFSAPAGSGLGGGGFGGDSGGDGDRPAPVPAQSRSFGGGRVTGNGIEEIIQISLLPEKEGMFMFQHHNYQVSSSRRGSKVVRRYSDFVWLLDCLQKRYPFRQLPLLPPKRVGGM